MVVVVAVGTADIKKKKRKCWFYLCGWVVVDTDGQTVSMLSVLWISKEERKKEKRKKPIPVDVDGRGAWW